jgi:hypothetical protein
MLMWQPAAWAAAWPAAAIRDTVVAITSDPAFAVRVGPSLLERILGFVSRHVWRLISALEGTPAARYAALAALAVVALAIVARLVVSMRSDTAIRRLRTGRAGGGAGDALAEAHRLAAAGDYTAAAHALYAAVLGRVVQGHRIRIDPSMTSGDWVRELRRRGSPLTAPFRTFSRRWDRIIFGTGQCTPQQYEALLADAMPMLGQQAAA